MKDKRTWLARKMGKRLWLFGFFGLCGCFGFRYFSSGDVGDLFYFAFFGFFAWFILGKPMGEIPDERLAENCRKAAFKCFFIPMLALFVIGYAMSRDYGTKEFVVLVSALGWAATLLSYAILVWLYEKR